ncbi:MAG TPA: hypothetical protein VK633_14625 [Verrucomicrobiae bacterium]|nr:hypothetical protein [Verrucomicrobiae bacterium]
MKFSRFLVYHLLAIWGGLNLCAQSTNLTGQWDFNQGDLRATIGTNLQFRGGSSGTTFETTVINGATAHVMHFPAATPSQGYILTHGAQPNGGGTNVNIYTLIMDMMWPAESDGTFRALFNTDRNNLEDAVMFVNPDNAVGINNNYSGSMDPGIWYRLALVFDLPNGTVTKYLNGQTNETSTQFLGENVIDSRFSAGPSLLLFTDNDNETRSGFVDRIQFIPGALTPEQVVALGNPVGDGGPPVGAAVKIESIQKTGNNVVLTVSGGGNLQLQKKVKLTDSTWQNVGQPSTGSTFTVPASDPTGFFRVQRL